MARFAASSTPIVPSTREPDARYLVSVLPRGTLVDSCVLIDVLANDPTWAEWSLDQLDRCASLGPLLINPLILAEICPRFERAIDLEMALADLPLFTSALPWDAAFLAGQAFKVYRMRMSSGLKTSPMAELYIGAHALVSQLQLLTRDAARFRRYFPALPLVAPA